MSTRKTHKSRRRATTKRTQGVQEPVIALVKHGSGSSSVPSAPVPDSTTKDVPDKPFETGDSDLQPKLMLPPPKAEKPYWYRPPDSKARKNFEKIAVLRAAGHDDHEIAKRLHTTEQSVRQYVYIAKMNKWADEDGEPVDLEAQMAMDVDRKLVRNLDRALDGGFTNYQTHEVTMGLMKVRKVVTNIDQAGAAQMMPGVVAIQIVMPPLGAEQQVIVERNVGGMPAFTEGQVLQSSTLDPIRTLSTSPCHPELQKVFDSFCDVNIAIVGSATQDYALAHDIDVLVLSDKETFKRIVQERGYRYLGGFDKDGVRIRRTDHFTLDGVSKRIQLLQRDPMSAFEEYPHCVLLRSGQRLHDGVFHQK